MMFKEKTKEQTNVKRIVEKYNNITLSLSNYENAFREIQNNIQIIDVQFENLLTDVSDANKEYKKIGNNEETKASLRNDLVPLKLFDILYNDMYLKNNEMIVWMTLKDELITPFYQQIVSLMSTVKSLEIQQEATKEMREYIKLGREDDKNRLDKMLDFFENNMLANFKNMQSETLVTFEKLMNNTLGIFKEKDGEMRNFFEILGKENAQLRNDLQGQIKPYEDHFKKVQEDFDKNTIAEPFVPKPKVEIVKKDAGIPVMKDKLVPEDESEFGFGDDEDVEELED